MRSERQLQRTWARTFIGCAIAAMLVGAVGAGGIAGGQQPLSQSEVHRQRRDALRAGGLRAAAAVTGTYIGVVMPSHWGGPNSLENLAEVSAVVAVGKPISNVAEATLEGRSIHTYYKVRLATVMKGDTQEGAAVTIIVPGGRISFEDGSWAHLNTPGFQKPEPGRQHVWFLKPAPRGLVEGHEQTIGETAAFIPVFGPLGVYPLRGDRTRVSPSGGFETEFAAALRREHLDDQAFIARVRAASRPR